MIDVVMPQLGESVVEGTITKWLVREGDFVKREQPLLEVATDKADTEIPAPSDGRVARVVAAEGAVIAKGGLLCSIDEQATGSATGQPSEQATKREIPMRAEVQPPKAEERGRTLSSPAVKKLAREAGVDLQQVQGTGERGRITHEDVKRAADNDVTLASSPPPKAVVEQRAAAADVRANQPTERSRPVGQTAELSQLIQSGGGFVPPIPGVGFGSYKVPAYVPKPGDEVIPFNRRRRITADHMVYSKLTSPHVVTVAEVDLYATAKIRETHKNAFKKEGIGLTFLAFVAAAAAKALREHPGINARVLDNSYVVLRDINLGIAVDTPAGLIVPSIKNADELSLRGIAKNIDDVAARARAGKLTADDLTSTTFTVSNPGLKGNLFGGAIISQPTVGILRMGEIKKRVVVVTKDGEDSMAIHPVMFLALSYDHRIIDGVLGNSFLWRVADILGRGEFVL